MQPKDHLLVEPCTFDVPVAHHSSYTVSKLFQPVAQSHYSSQTRALALVGATPVSTHIENRMNGCALLPSVGMKKRVFLVTPASAQSMDSRGRIRCLISVQQALKLFCFVAWR